MLYGQDFQNALRDEDLFHLWPWALLKTPNAEDAAAALARQIEHWYSTLSEEAKKHFRERLRPRKRTEAQDFVGAVAELYAIHWFSRLDPQPQISYEPPSKGRRYDLLVRAGGLSIACEVYSPKDRAEPLDHVNLQLTKASQRVFGPGYMVVLGRANVLDSELPTNALDSKLLTNLLEEIGSQYAAAGTPLSWRGQARTRRGPFWARVTRRTVPDTPTRGFYLCFRSTRSLLAHIRRKLPGKAAGQLRAANADRKMLFVLSGGDAKLEEDGWFRVFYGAAGPPVQWGRYFHIGKEGFFTEPKGDRWHRSYISAAIAGDWRRGSTDVRPHLVAYLNPHAEVSVPETLFQGIPIYRLVPGRDAILMERVPPLVEE